MMFTSSQQWVLVGLTSNGFGCARPMYPGIYTRVAAFESWINSYTNGSVSTLTPSTGSTTQSIAAKITVTSIVPVIYLHANILRISVFNVPFFVLCNLFVKLFY